MKKIFFVDIDGTIINCGRGLSKPTDRTIEAFNKIKANGDYVFIASGRAKCLLPDSIPELEPSGYILANGAYAEIDGRILFMDSMDIDTKNRIMDFANKYNGAYYLETVNEIYTRDLKLKAHRNYAEKWGVLKCYRDTGYHDNCNVNITMMAFLEDHNREMFEELSNCVDINPHVGAYSCDLNIKGVNKGTGVNRILKMLDIRKEDSYAFGDGINDIEMMESVGHAVAMDNACDELKRVSNEITDDVMKDGVYSYLVRNNIIR